MKMYISKTKYHCGVDLHKSLSYICVMDREGKIYMHKAIQGNDFAYMKKILAPYWSSITIACESTYNWYILADFCVEEGIEFALGHALYMKSIHGGKVKNDREDSKKIADLLRINMLPFAYACPAELRANRDLLRRRIKLIRERAGISTYMGLFEQQNGLNESSTYMRTKITGIEKLEEFQNFQGPGAIALKRNYDFNTSLLFSYVEELEKIDKDLNEMTINSALAEEYELVQTMPGVGKILGMTLIYETQDISRFESVGRYASYCRVIKCKKESAGKNYGYGGVKIGNPFLKWAFSQIAVLSKRDPFMKAYSQELEKRHGKRKARSIYTHKICRSIYFMLLRRKPFDRMEFFGLQKYERLQRMIS